MDKNEINLGFEYVQKVETVRNGSNGALFAKKGTGRIRANGKTIYQFSEGNEDLALARFRVLKNEILNHPYDFLNPEKEKNRKVWFYSLPSVIKPNDAASWIIEIKADENEISQDEWFSELEKALLATSPNQIHEEIKKQAQQGKRQGCLFINDIINESNIIWHR